MGNRFRLPAHIGQHLSRYLRFETLEDRRVLASMADIVFLVDESGSEQNSLTQDWIATIVDDLHATFAASGIDVRYGLVGFGQDYDNGTPTVYSDDGRRFAHSQLLGPAGNKTLWTNNYVMLTSALTGELGQIGAENSEDGWDAFENAIAEYEFAMARFLCSS